GRVILDGQDIAGKDRVEIVRRGVVRAFQVASLFPSFTVEEALAAGVLSHARRSAALLRRFPPSDAIGRAREIMALLELTDRAGTAARYLSHGDQKLLDIALALTLEPRVLLL